jgi:hypothetical protein
VATPGSLRAIALALLGVSALASSLAAPAHAAPKAPAPTPTPEHASSASYQPVSVADIQLSPNGTELAADGRARFKFVLQNVGKATAKNVKLEGSCGYVDPAAGYSSSIATVEPVSQGWVLEPGQMQWITISCNRNADLRVGEVKAKHLSNEVNTNNNFASQAW